MGSMRRSGLIRVVVVFAWALLGALMFRAVAEHFGWRLFREAGDQIVRATSQGDCPTLDASGADKPGGRDVQTQAGLFILS